MKRFTLFAAIACLFLFFPHDLAHGLKSTRVGHSKTQSSECGAADGRFFSYSADYDFGETPPYSIKSKITEVTKEYLVRKINTRGTFFLEGELPRDVVDEDWGSIIEYIGIGAAVIIFLCFLGVLSCIWNFIKGQGLQDEEFTLKGLLMAIAVFAVIA